MINQSICELAQKVLQIEAEAILELKPRIDETFQQACELILDCSGRIVVIGMGKSGHIGKKIAATFASTGTPAFFVHPSEACHGDMGMITKKDIILIISNSGETPEILSLLPFLKRIEIPLITLTGKKQSTLAKAATTNLDISISHEACPLGLAPTSSTTVALVMGDALAVVLLQTRGFTSNDFALFHPAGTLGKRLLLRTKDLMHTHDKIPKVQLDTSLRETLYEMTIKKLGMTTVCDENNKLHGIYTDGDLRRSLDDNLNINSTPVNTVMTKNCRTIHQSTLAVEALNIMQHKKITTLVITDDNNAIEGVIHLHDLLQAGVT